MLPYFPPVSSKIAVILVTVEVCYGRSRVDGTSINILLIGLLKNLKLEILYG